jgi:hypothetical protein
MLLVEQKKSENVAEFVLYMFQMEDLIRMFGFDLDLLMEGYVSKSLSNKAFEPQYRLWFKSVIEEMKSNALEKEGHVEVVKETIIELVYLHNTLQTIIKDDKYIGLCEQSKEAIEEFRQKAKMQGRHDVEVLFHAMYMKLQLKIRKQVISEETESAMDLMRIQLAYLSREYKRMYAGGFAPSPN